MKAGILYSPKDIRIGEAPTPEIGPNDILLESKAAGICGTDHHIYLGEFEARVSYPAIQGHEFGGVIAEVGKNVQDYKPGDRVVVDPIVSCYNCPACLTGHINACRTLKILGVDLDGGFGQYVAVPVDHGVSDFTDLRTSVTYSEGICSDISSMWLVDRIYTFVSFRSVHECHEDRHTADVPVEPIGRAVRRK